MFFVTFTMNSNGSVKVQKGDGVKEVQMKRGRKNPVAIMKIYDPVMFL